jgi:hypothetical protein
MISTQGMLTIKTFLIHKQNLFNKMNDYSKKISQRKLYSSDKVPKDAL